jgi:hypothetical protein
VPEHGLKEHPAKMLTPQGVPGFESLPLRKVKNTKFDFDPCVFCGILEEWLSNIKENQIYLVWFVEKKYTKGPSKSAGTTAEFFVV